MKTNKFFGFAIVLLVFSLFAVACGGTDDNQVGVLPQGTPPPDAGAVATETLAPVDVQGAVNATLTAMAPVSTYTPAVTATPVATVTQAPTDTSMPTPTLDPSAGLPPELAALPVDDRSELWDTNSPSWDYVFRSAVSTPGQPARYQVSFVGSFSNVTILKMSVDDMLVAAYMISPDGTRTDISTAFKAEKIPPGGFDTALNKVLTSRFLDVKKGEILPHITNAIWLGNVPAGTKLEFFVKDDASLAVNRGLGLVLYFNTTADALPGGKLYVVDTKGEVLK